MPVSTIVYIPFHLHRAVGGSIQEFWSTCNVATVHSQPHYPESILAPNKGSKQDQQDIPT